MEVCNNAPCMFCLTKCTLRVTRACLVLVNKQKYIYIYIYVTTMYFKENYCVIQQGSFILFIARDMLTCMAS